MAVNSKCILVSHPDHVEYARVNYPDAVIISRSQVLIDLFPSTKIDYFYGESSNESISEKSVIAFSNNWYRDENGEDRFHINGFSVPQILTGSIKIGVASHVREFIAFSTWTRRFDMIYISESEDDVFMRVAKFFGSVIGFYDPINSGSYWGAWLQERKLRNFLGTQLGNVTTSFLKSLLYFRNGSFPRRYQRKTLIFSDWTNFKNPILRNGIWTNCKNPLKSALIFTNRYSDGIAADFMPIKREVLNGEINFQDLNSIYGIVDIDMLKIVLVDYIYDLIDKNIDILRLYISQVVYLFETYHPERIVVPGEIFEPFTAAIQVASKYSSETILMVDGHDSVGDSLPSLWNAGNSDLLINSYVVSSSIQYEYARSRDIPESKIITQDSIFYFLHSSLKKVASCYEVIVLTWIPNHQNPNARNDSPAKTLYDVLSVASKVLNGRIGIKVKDPLLELEYVNTIVNSLHLSDRVDVLTGRFSDHVMKSELFIGGFSSAIAECSLHQKRYVVYEPPSNGYGEFHTDRCCVSNNFRIARDGTDLINMVENGTNSLECNPDRYLKCEYPSKNHIT